MNFEHFVAKRYLLSKKKIQFITLITWISIIGVTVGVAALITVLSVFNGFNKFQVTTLTGFDPHLRIEPDSGGMLSGYGTLIERIKNELNPGGAAPFTLNKGLISSGKNNVVVFLKGVDDRSIGTVSDVAEKTGVGEFIFDDSENLGGIVLGLHLADRLAAKWGDTLVVMSTAGMEKALTQIVQPRTMRFVVRGLFNSDNREYDKLYAFISIEKSQKLFELGNNVNGIELRLDNINKSDDARRSLIQLLGKGYKISTWFDLHEDLYSVMKVERWTAFIILSIIILVASFSIAGSLTMTVIEKKRDIGVLKAMGTTNRSIIRIFMLEGILIGLYGTVIGCALGLAVCLVQIRFKLFPLDPMVYPIDALPVDIRYADFIFVSLSAMALSFLASLYPATRAARQEPIESIRWE